MSRYIDADALIESIKNTADLGGWIGETLYQIKQVAIKYIDSAPGIDIVRCKECKWWVDNLTENDDDEAYDSCRWDWSRKIPTAVDFCSCGEREGE